MHAGEPDHRRQKRTDAASKIIAEPLAGAAQMALKMREDVVTDGGYPDKILANAPERAGSFFVVPKVVE